MAVVLTDRFRRMAAGMRDQMQTIAAQTANVRLLALQEQARQRGLIGTYPYPSVGALLWAMRRKLRLATHTLTEEEAKAVVEASKEQIVAIYGPGIEHLLETISSPGAVSGRVIQGVVLTIAGIVLGAAIGGPLGAVIGGAIGLICGIILAIIPFEAIAFNEEWKRWIDGLQPIDRYCMLSGMREILNSATRRTRTLHPDWTVYDEPLWQIHPATNILVNSGSGAEINFLGIAEINCWDLLFCEKGSFPDPKVPLPSGTAINDPKNWDQVALYGACAMVANCGDPDLVWKGKSAKDGLNSPELVKSARGYDLVVTQRKANTWLAPYLEAVKDWSAGNLRTYAAQWSEFSGVRRGVISLAKTSGTQGFTPGVSNDMPDHQYVPVTGEMAVLISERQNFLANTARWVESTSG